VPSIFTRIIEGEIPAHILREVTRATRVGMAVVGLEVPHAHLHLVPIDGLHDLDFRRARPANDEDLAATAERIRAAIAN
jgi:histidine triad (HIT) family protein